MRTQTRRPKGDSVTPRRGDPPASRASGPGGSRLRGAWVLGFSPQGGESDFLLIQSRWSGGLCPGALMAAGVCPHVCPAVTCSSDRPVARVRTALHTVCLPLTRPTSRAVREPLRVVTKSVCEPLPGHGSHFSGGGGDLGEAMGNARTRGYRPRSGATPPVPPLRAATTCPCVPDASPRRPPQV